MNTKPSMHRNDIVFEDESGDHGLTSIDEIYSLFVLCLRIVEKTAYTGAIVPRIKRFKVRHLRA